MSDKAWRSYEILTEVIFRAIFLRDQVPTLTVERDVILQSTLGPHQIDLCLRFELGGVEYQTIVQTKNWSKPVDKFQLLGFKQILDDLPGQPRGIFVTRSGYQSGAKEVALKLGILLYELMEAEDLPNLALTIGGWAKYKLISMPLHGLITNGEPDIKPSSAIAWGFDYEVFTPQYTNIKIEVTVDWLTQTHPGADVSQLTIAMPRVGCSWQEILLYNDDGAAVGNLGVVLAKISQSMQYESVTSKRVTHVLKEPAFILTQSQDTQQDTQQDIQRVKIVSVSADVEMIRRREIRRAKMSNFPQLLLHQLNSGQSYYFAVTQSVLDRILAA
jgi:Restriction endonuclease